MIVGFTGTQIGMTKEQKESFTIIIDRIKPTIFLHGDCIGADTEAHTIVRNLSETRIGIYPPKVSTWRGWNKGDFICNPLPFLIRNHNIVDASDILIATPKEIDEQLRSGTWATVRYTKKKHKPIIFIFPNGEVRKHT